LRIGVAKEIKTHEYRVALTPAGARELEQLGHEVLVETTAGEGSAFPDSDYERAGAAVISYLMKRREIDAKKIALLGRSAGGHLAIATATSFENRTYEPVDDADKTSCRPDFAVPVYSGYLKAKEREELAPGIHVPARTPPVFLVHGGEDIISPPEHSVLMYLALKKAGVPAELHVYAGSAHDFGVRKNDHLCSAWTESCANWLRAQGFLQRGTKQ